MATQSDDPSTAQLKLLLGMLERDPGNRPLTIQCLDLMRQANDLSGVERMATTMLLADANDSIALFALAESQISRREFTAAIDTLSKVTDPDAALAVHHNLGLCHYLLGQFEQARVDLELCYAQNMTTPGVLRLLVSTLHHLGEMAAATSVARAHPTAATADSALAGVYAMAFLDADDEAAAAQYADLALRDNPDNIDALIAGAACDTLRGNAQRAELRYQKVLVRSPDNGRAWLGTGTLAMLRHDLPGAQANFREGLRLIPGHVGSWLTLAWIQLAAGQRADARATLDEAMKLDRNFSEVHGALASLDALDGKPAEARRAIEVAFRLDRDCLGARFAEAVLSGAAGDQGRAEQMIGDAVKLLALRRRRRPSVSSAPGSNTVQ